MRNYRQVVDLLNRRLGHYVKGDGVKYIYVDMKEDGPLQCTVILRSPVEKSRIVSVATRYIHVFDDMIDTVDIDVLSTEQYFKPTETMFPIYRERKGFDL